MALRRIKKAGAHYEITNNFHQGVIRFIDKKCKKIFIHFCHKANKKFKFKIRNICVTNTNINILIKPENGEDISEIMQFIKQCFTQWLNRRFGIKGTAWETRFFSKIVEIAEEIIRSFIRIEQNPIREGLVNRSNLSAYPFYEVWIPLSQDELRQFSP